MLFRKTLLSISGAALLSGCQASLPPLETVEYVDLDRFMGDWYVIANIPTFVEKGAHNAVETYRLEEDGTVATTFTFRDGGFDGKLKQYHPRGFVRDNTGNAVWGMQFVWPVTIIGRNKRDYVWLMARTPSITDSWYREAVSVIEAAGYDLSELQRVPQQW